MASENKADWTWSYQEWPNIPPPLSPTGFSPKLVREMDWQTGVMRVFVKDIKSGLCSEVKDIPATVICDMQPSQRDGFIRGIHVAQISELSTLLSVMEKMDVA